MLPSANTLQESAAPRRIGPKLWVVTRHSDARQILADHDRFSSNFPNQNTPDELKSFINADPPEHTLIRRLLAPEFSAKSIGALRPQVKHLVGQLVGDMLMETAPVDLVEKVVRPTTFGVLAMLLGLDIEDQRRFDRWFEIFQNASSSVEQRRAAGSELYEHVRVSIQSQSRDLNFIPARLASRCSGLTEREIVATAANLVIAGYESTVSLTGIGILTLFKNPDHLDAYRQDPEMRPRIFQEIVRYVSVVPGVTRVATADVDLDGQVIHAGDKIVVSLPASSWDRDEFTQPHVFSHDRPLNHHLGFGHGIHHCLGRMLAQVLFAEIMESLLKVSNLHLASTDASSLIRGKTAFHGVWSLPVAWNKRGPSCAQ